MAIGLGVLVLMFPESGITQEFRYNWRGDVVTYPGVIRSGQTLRIQITDLNALCYDFTLSARDLRSAASVPDPLGLLAGTLVPTSKDAPPNPTRATDAQGADSGRTADFETKGFLPVDQVRGATRTVVDNQLDAIDAKLDLIADRVALATGVLNRISKSQVAAEKALVELYAYACPSGARGLEIVDPAKVALIRTTSAALLAVFDSLADADTALTSATGIDKGTETLIEALPPAQQLTSQQSSRALNAASQLAEYRAAISALRDNALASAKKLDASAYRQRHALVVSRIADTPITREVATLGTSDSILIVVRAAGRAEIPTAKGVVIESPFVVHVRRRHRMLTSAGFMMSLLNDHDYARVNRPAFSGTNPDSVYSTYIDRSDGNALAFSPVLMASVSLLDFSDASLYGTIGVAARTVNGGSGPDFLLGLSLGVADAFLLSPVLHVGRRQVLLLGDDDVVAARPIPISVTDEQAVGERWAFVLGLVASIKLP